MPLFLAALSIVLLECAALHFFSIGVAPAWRAEVLVRDIDRISGLVRLASGTFVVTQERSTRGRLLSIEAGDRRVLRDGLVKPDGLALAHGTLYASEEGPVGCLYRDPGGEAERVLDCPGRLESVAVDPVSGDIVTVRDVPRDGTLFRYRGGERETLMRDLDQPEGVCVANSGAIYVTEKATGILWRVSPGESPVAVIRGLQSPGYVACAGPVLWITEDATNSGRLLRLADGRLSVIATRLHAPQTVLPVGDGVLLTEQRRGRILRFARRTPRPAAITARQQAIPGSGRRRRSPLAVRPLTGRPGPDGEPGTI